MSTFHPLPSPSATCSAQPIRRVPATGKYGPSEHQVNLVYNEMMKAYRTATAAIASWQGVDRELLLLKLRNKLQGGLPELFEQSSCKDGDAGDDDEQNAASFSDLCTKKRNVKGGPVIIHDIRIPKEVVAHFIPYLDRSSVNNFSLTCRGALHIIQDRNVVPTIPWPMKCPFQLSGDLTSIIASGDGSRIAVVSDDVIWNSTEPDYYGIQIWDRFQGLIGEMTYYDWEHQLVFSPDSQLLIGVFADRSEEQDYEGEFCRAWDGLLAVQLPIDKRDGSTIVVSNHHFGEEGHDLVEGFPRSVAFVGNSSIASFEEIDRDAVDGTYTDCLFELNIRTINRENNNGCHINFNSEYQTIMRFDEQGEVASFINGNANKSFLAVACQDELIFHDMQSNASTTISQKQTQNDDRKDSNVSLAFSKNGTLVVTRLHGGLEVYDFANVNTIKEIGDPRYIPAPVSSDWARIVSFSSDGTKAVLRFQLASEPRIRIIDLQTGEIIPDRWDHSAWRALVN